MTFVDSVKTCLSKYADFKGRASKSEYWWFMLFYIVVYVVLMILASAIHPVLMAAILALFLPTLAAGARRLHDTDRSGWMMLLGLIPLVGLIVIYFMIQDPKEPNRFGPAPAA